LTDRTTAELEAWLQSLREQIFGPWQRACAVLFEAMVQQIGYEEAKRIFVETGKHRRPKAGPKRPPPRKQKGRLHNPNRDMMLLAGWEGCKDLVGNNKMEFARKQMEANRMLPRPYRVGSSTGQIVRRLNKLLSAGITPERLQADILKRMG